MEPHLRRVALLAALALAGCGGAKPSPGPPVTRGTLTIGPTSQYDLVHHAPLHVQAGAPGAGELTLGVTVRDGVGPPHPLATGVRVQSPGAVTVATPPAAASAVSGCKPLRLEAVLRDGNRVVARDQRVLAPDAPDCGRFFAPGSVWNKPLASDAPVDSRSATYVSELRQQVEHEFAINYTPTIATTSYSTPVYTVPAQQRRVPVRFVGRGAEHFGKALAAVMAQGVPIPPGAKPGAGTDGHLVVWQPATDTMWELWRAARAHGTWTAQWGGRMANVSRSPGYFYDASGTQPGATATSLPLVGGLITLADLKRGSIDHALAMAIPESRYGVWSVPAQRTDGVVHSTDAIPDGVRFRLDPKLDIASLHLPPFTAMLARAAQRYGILVRDKSAVVTFYAEDPTPTGNDPWTAAMTPSRSEVMRRFPWDRLEALRTDLRTYSGKKVSR